MSCMDISRDFNKENSSSSITSSSSTFLFPTLKTIMGDGILLRPVSITQDFEIARKIFGDPKMMKYWENGNTQTDETIWGNFKEWEERAFRGDISWRTIINEESGKSVGFFATTLFLNPEEGKKEEFSGREKCIEISYYLAECARGQDYTRRAFIAALRQAIPYVGPVDYIRAHIHPGNKNSIRFIEKLGFEDMNPGGIHHYNKEYAENGERKEYRLPYRDCCRIVRLDENGKEK